MPSWLHGFAENQPFTPIIETFRGLLAGARAHRNELRRFVLGSLAIALGLVGLQLAFSIPSLCALAFVAGLPIAPTIAVVYTLIDRSARHGTAAEAFAWFGTAISVGIANVCGRKSASTLA